MPSETVNWLRLGFAVSGTSPQHQDNSPNEQKENGEHGQDHSSNVACLRLYGEEEHTDNTANKTHANEEE